MTKTNLKNTTIMFDSIFDIFKPSKFNIHGLIAKPPAQDWERKTCKSCIHFQKFGCASIRPVKAKAKACKSYFKN